MNLYIDKTPYWFKPEGIKKAEELYGGATHMGYWCLRGMTGSWMESPCDIFYQPNPDRDKGHTNYFGLFIRDEHLYVTNGESAFSDKILGLLLPSGEVLVSRYRHDFNQKGEVFVDGGRDYFKRGGGGRARMVEVSVNGPDFTFNVLES